MTGNGREGEGEEDAKQNALVFQTSPIKNVLYERYESC